MRKHIVRKSLGLIVLYAVIIVGIFVIQFRSDSIIRKTIRSMRVTLVEAESTDGSAALKNQFQIAYNGIQFTGDDSNSVEYVVGDSTRKAVLKTYEETENSLSLIFDDDITITFSLSEVAVNSPLIITADFPAKISYVSLITKPLTGYSFTDQKAKQAIVEGKNSSYSLLAPMLQDSRLLLLQNSKFASYRSYVKQTEFSIDAVANLAGASKAEWQNSLNTLSATIISEFMRLSQSDVSFASSLSEQTVIAYAAAMSNAGRYNEAINTVPASFTKGTKRTYQSAPFFGTLAKVAPSLEMQMENYKSMVSHALQASSCDVFTTGNIADYFVINENDPEVARVLSMPASLTNNNFTVAQAAGILHVYAVLKTAESANAEKLVPVLEPCIKKITDSCKLDNNKIRLAENDTNLSVIAAVNAGDAFIEYGTIEGMENVEKCGYLIVNSYLSDLAGLDLRTMCEIYPIAVHDNPYYPHFAKIRDLDGTTIWAWTIARDIKITQDENRTLFVDIDFPLGLTHYVMIIGINPFRRIQIYNMDFRTDPQFEIYNSSGYVYRSSMRGLLLKSRHKSQHEIIKLYYREVAAQ